MRELTPKMLRGAMIDKAGKKWDTKPERLFAEYARLRGMGLLQNQTVSYQALNRRGFMQTFDFQLDFARPRDWQRYAITGLHLASEPFEIDFEVDGEGHNFKNDKWKDEVKTANGLKVVHIPGGVCEKKYWEYLDKAIPLALENPDPVVKIVG
jgi:hypothetical protein